MGAPAEQCPACGNTPRAGARFCDCCGAPLAGRSAPAEYKHVTVLFVDVVRSMDMAAALEDLKARVQLFMGLINGSRAAPATNAAASTQDSGTATPEGDEAAGAGASEVSK